MIRLDYNVWMNKFDLSISINSRGFHCEYKTYQIKYKQ